MQMRRILSISLIMLTAMACSNKGPTRLNDAEIAQELISQQLTENRSPDHILTIHHVIPEKPVIEKELEITIELIAKTPLKQVKLAIQPEEGLKFKNKWWILSQSSYSVTLKDLKEDQIYRETITVIPTEVGLLSMDVFTIYKLGNEDTAKKKRIDLLIGQQSEHLDAPDITSAQ